MYFSGAVRPELMGESRLGFIITPHMGNKWAYPGVGWCADTGCYSKPDSYNRESYTAWLEKKRTYFAECRFATAPDRLGDARATMRAAIPELAHIRKLVPVALVGQPGIERLRIPWDDFDCLFMGGHDGWKFSEAGYGLVNEAKARGKWVHLGRCNSQRRLRRAAMSGYDSADGTFLAFGPEKNWPRLKRWLVDLDKIPPLPHMDETMALIDYQPGLLLEESA